MNNLTISCPSCGFSRQIPYDKVPEGPRRVTCPKCTESFIYTKPDETSALESQEKIPAAPETDATPKDSQAAAAKPDSSSPPPSGPPPRPVTHELTDIGELFQESWTLFKRRFLILIGLCLLGIVAFIAPVLLSAGLVSMTTSGGVTFVAIITVGVLVGILCGIWCFGGFLCAVVDDGLNLKGALARGQGMILPLAWVSLLSGFIICGGYMLLIIPGIIFSVWFVFAQFVLVEDDVRGMSALLKSTEYLRGQWFSVALRLLLIWAVSGIVSVIPLVGPFLSLAFFPYVIIFHYLIFRDLRQLKGDVPFSCGTGDKLLWPGVALIGLVIVPAILISIAGFSMFGALSQLAPLAKGKVFQGAQTLQVEPQQEGQLVPAAPAMPAEGDSTEAGPASSEETPNVFSPDDEYPNVSVFIYAVNYTGEILANSTVIQNLEGEPDMQYNYNLNGKSFRYGQNRIEVKFAELPNPPSTMLEIHMRVSSYLPNGEKKILGEWRLNDKGTGTKTFDFDIPK